MLESSSQSLWENEIIVYMNICSTQLKFKKYLTYVTLTGFWKLNATCNISPETAELRIWMTLKEMRQVRTLFFYKHTSKLGWSSVCLRFSQFEPEIVLDGMLNFKTHFIIWYCVLIWILQWSLLNIWIRTFNWVWHEHCNGLFNIRNLVSSLIVML